jgi:hypothetical protein
MIVPTSMEPLRPRNRASTQLQLPIGELDIAAVKAAITEWVVPLLVKKFLVESTSVASQPAAVLNPSSKLNSRGTN